MNENKKDVIITLNHLYKEYDGVLAVEDFNFYVKKGLIRKNFGQTMLIH